METLHWIVEDKQLYELVCNQAGSSVSATIWIQIGCPRSVTILGTPIQPLVKALATDSAVVDVIGMASGHLVKWSTHVKR